MARGWFWDGRQKRYKRVSLRNQYRKWYEHRAIVDKLTREWSFYGPGIPDGWTIHHMDFCGANNAPENLLMVCREIHDYMSKESREAARCPYTGKYLDNTEKERRWRDQAVPDWVLDPDLT